MKKTFLKQLKLGRVLIYFVATSVFFIFSAPGTLNTSEAPGGLFFQAFTQEEALREQALPFEIDRNAEDRQLSSTPDYDVQEMLPAWF
jgi:hypothetical protein